MNRLIYTQFLESLSIGNRTEVRNMDRETKQKLGSEVLSGDYFPTAEMIEGYMGGLPIEGIRPFVFTDIDRKQLDLIAPDENLSLPFQSTWVELYNEPLFTRELNAVIEVTGNKFEIQIDYGQNFFDRTVTPGKRVRARVKIGMMGALVIEAQNPGDSYQAVVYDEFRVIETLEGDTGNKLFEQYVKAFGDRPFKVEVMSVTLHHSLVSEKFDKNSEEGKLYLALQALFQSVRSKTLTTGTATVSERVKVGSGDKRRLIKIKDLVIVAPQREQGKIQERMGLSREVDWSHRWDVMGHWRKTGGIGKDRNGSYRVKGYTWVMPHVKGPADAPLIPKTRLVKIAEETDEG